jgi:pimeloyl-ACP methyl ester carboxylesterase
MTTEADGPPPILFLHPIGLDRTVWSQVMPPGATALDYPGHGTTEYSGPVSMAGLAEWVLRHISRPTTLVGLSLGGMVAQQVAVREPAAVASLVVACSSAASRERAMRERAAATRETGMPGVLRSTLERWFTPDALATPGHPGVEYARDRLLAADPEIVARYWEAMAGHDVADRLASISVPTTFIAGAADPSSPPPVLANMARQVPGAQLRILDGPHMLTLERPQEFAATLHEHLDRLEAHSPGQQESTTQGGRS